MKPVEEDETGIFIRLSKGVKARPPTGMVSRYKAGELAYRTKHLGDAKLLVGEVWLIEEERKK